MKVLVVSGFLGAGKTTFIRELIRRTGSQIAVLENEFGETNIDSTELAKAGDIEILEFMEGCVCCSKKDSFVNSILAVSAGLDPEYLVVEPTGVARLGNILDSIRKIAYEKIVLLKPVMVLSPRSFQSNLNEFGDIYTDQIRNASTIVFSKAEAEDPAFLDSVALKIHARNPDADIVRRHYSSMPDEWWNGLLLDENDKEAVVESAPSAPIDEITVQTAHFRALKELIIFLEDTLRGRFGGIVRAKGVLCVGGEFLRFDLADGLYAIIGEEADAPVSQCVFIGTGLKTDDLLERLHVEEKEAKSRLRRELYGRTRRTGGSKKMRKK